MVDDSKIGNDENEDEEFTLDDPEGLWDEEFGQTLVGHTLYVEVKNIDKGGNVLGIEQVFGKVQSVSAIRGIKILQTNGKVYTMPAMLPAIEPGSVQTYQLIDSDEQVVKPDFISRINAQEPPFG